MTGKLLSDAGEAGVELALVVLAGLDVGADGGVGVDVAPDLQVRLGRAHVAVAAPVLREHVLVLLDALAVRPGRQVANLYRRWWWWCGGGK